MYLDFTGSKKKTLRSRTLLGSDRGLTQSRYMSSSGGLTRFKSLVLLVLSPSIIGERRLLADMPGLNDRLLPMAADYIVLKIKQIT